MEIGVLGPVELRGGAGAAVPVAGARLRTLLLLLALDAGRVVSTDRLIDGVWGGEPPQAAGNALQALVSRLRRAAPELVLEATPNGYRLVIDPECVDAIRFVRVAAEDPAAALELWRGELDFPEAARADAVRLEELRLATMRRKLAAQPDAVPELEGLVAQHPLDEPLAGLLMRALHEQGSSGRALEVFQGIRERLAEQLGTDPSPELAELHLDLLRATDPVPVRGNLPAEVSSFVGRERDVRTVRELIAGHRLVTLLGPGGNGKTRLSVEVGVRVPGEVWRVELAPVTDPAEVPQALLTALRLRGQVLLGRLGTAESVPPPARLAEALAGREMLLILDNCEHLIGAAAEVADTLLRAAPGLRLLTTSREPLGIPGERLYAVEPLALPPVGTDAAVASGFPSVRLLLDRAAFSLTVADVDAVVRICRALDGMPLAIELAAARLRTVPVAVLADHLPQLEAKLAHQLYLAGEHDEARRVLKQSRAEAEEIGPPEVLASVQYCYATIARLEGDLEVARDMIGRPAGMMSNPAFAPQFGSMTRSAQGLIEAAAGDLELARRCHQEAVTIAVESRDSPVIAMSLVGVADLVLREGDPERAAFLPGAADAVRGGRDRTVPDTDRITFGARAALGDAGFEAAYRRAAGMTLATVRHQLDAAADGPCPIPLKVTSCPCIDLGFAEWF